MNNSEVILDRLYDYGHTPQERAEVLNFMRNPNFGYSSAVYKSIMDGAAVGRVDRDTFELMIDSAVAFYQGDRELCQLLYQSALGREVLVRTHGGAEKASALTIARDVAYTSVLVTKHWAEGRIFDTTAPSEPPAQSEWAGVSISGPIDPDKVPDWVWERVEDAPQQNKGPKDDYDDWADPSSTKYGGDGGQR